MKLYLETTIPNYLLATDVPHEKEITEKFFDLIRERKHQVFVSEVVVGELLRTSNVAKRKQLLEIVSGISTFPLTEECSNLAGIYVTRGIIPQRYFPDALHIAIATMNKTDVLVTWNMRHMANPFTRIKIRELNLEKGLKPIDISTPEEVIAGGY